jgi:hypothetical protein
MCEAATHQSEVGRRTIADELLPLLQKQLI